MVSFDIVIMAREKLMTIISFIVPTYNSERTIDVCLKSIRNQQFDQNEIEIVLVDGGSIDKTLEISNNYNVNILKNLKKDHPVGRPLGIRKSKGIFVCLLDSDNILVSNDWLKKMMMPFSNKNVIAAEPLNYEYQNDDNLITKYCSLIGGDDPIIVQLGFSDKYSHLIDNWTLVPRFEKKHNGWIEVNFKNSQNIPSIGANGTIVKRDYLESINIDPFYHIDVCQKLITNNKLRSWAKVNIGIRHLHSDTLSKFIKKKQRRLARRVNEADIGYLYPIKKTSVLIIILKSILIVPILIDSFYGYKKAKSLVWIIHPLLHYITLFLYIYYGSVKLFYKSKKMKSYENV